MAYYCDRCKRQFPHYSALEQHKEHSNSHWDCSDCNLDFESYDARMWHYIESPDHHYCKECDRHFKSDEARGQHMRDKHWYCRMHDRVFKFELGLHSHYRQSPVHNYCFKCEKDFDDEDKLWDHLLEAHYACKDCNELFNSYSELQGHDHEVHNYCTKCGRNFQNQNNLQQHLNSKLHRPSTVACPGHECEKSFISPAALTLHFESGTCPSGMTREQLNHLVVQADRNNYVTNPARLICGPLGGYEAPLSTSSWATELSRNGMEYECFLCHSTFNTPDSLYRHLKSPSHDKKIYRCPKLDCRVEFVTFSALCQHVESGSCGVRMFRPVRDAMESLTRGFHKIAF